VGKWRREKKVRQGIVVNIYKIQPLRTRTIGGAGPHFGADRSEGRGLSRLKTSHLKCPPPWDEQRNIWSLSAVVRTYIYILLMWPVAAQNGSLPPPSYSFQGEYCDTVTVKNLARLGPRTSFHMQDFSGWYRTLFPPLVRPSGKFKNDATCNVHHLCVSARHTALHT